MHRTVTSRVPFIDPLVLRRHRVFEATDSRFRAAARFHQALFRQKQGWRPGQIESGQGAKRSVGSLIKPSDAAAGANFLTREIAALARREIAYREDMAMVDQVRLWQNMLSSHPLVFNLFGPLKLDLTLATKVAQRLWPDTVSRVTDVLFEHSPSRRDPIFTDDRTAFDVLLQCQDRNGKNTFVAVEVKYSETMYEPAARLRSRYDELSSTSGLYREPGNAALRAVPLQSLWREHMLAAAMVQNDLYKSGRFVLIAPAANSPVQRAAETYRKQLADNPPIPFEAIALEKIIAVIRSVGAKKLADRLYERYVDFAGLDRFI